MFPVYRDEYRVSKAILVERSRCRGVAVWSEPGPDGTVRRCGPRLDKA